MALVQQGIDLFFCLGQQFFTAGLNQDRTDRVGNWLPISLRWAVRNGTKITSILIGALGRLPLGFQHPTTTNGTFLILIILPSGSSARQVLNDRTADDTDLGGAVVVGVGNAASMITGHSRATTTPAWHPSTGWTSSGCHKRSDRSCVPPVRQAPLKDIHSSSPWRLRH